MQDFIFIAFISFDNSFSQFRTETNQLKKCLHVQDGCTFPLKLHDEIIFLIKKKKVSLFP